MMMKGKCDGMCTAHSVAWALVLIGALNWGLVGLVQVNVVMTLLGSVPLLEQAVYVVVGLAALMMLMAKKCKACMACEHTGDKPMSSGTPSGMSGGMGMGGMQK